MTDEERAARIRAADRGKVIVRFICPPIPLRQFDWCAAFDDDEPDDNGNMRVGYGKTQSEAIDDLLGEVEVPLYRCTMCEAESEGDPPDCPRDGVHCNVVEVG